MFHFVDLFDEVLKSFHLAPHAVSYPIDAHNCSLNGVIRNGFARDRNGGTINGGRGNLRGRCGRFLRELPDDASLLLRPVPLRLRSRLSRATRRW